MIKWPITYKDYNDVERTEDFYFNLSKPELTEMQLTTDGGMDEKLTRIIKAKDNGDIIMEFKKIILAAYGERTDDGKYFIKKKNGIALSEMFEQSAAFEVLYMELSSDSDKASKFVNGIIPNDIPKETPATIAAALN